MFGWFLIASTWAVVVLGIVTIVVEAKHMTESEKSEAERVKDKQLAEETQEGFGTRGGRSKTRENVALHLRDRFESSNDGEIEMLEMGVSSQKHVQTVVKRRR